MHRLRRGTPASNTVIASRGVRFDNPGMRRIHVTQVQAGEVAVGPDEAHHIRDVLRLSEGEAVEVFDDGGRLGQGRIARCTSDELIVQVEQFSSATAAIEWSVASALPKGPRADWMVEKLSELGTTAFVPLATARSVVLPEGKSKKERWRRLAVESAKQSHRSGVMAIEDLRGVAEYVAGLEADQKAQAWYFSTAPGAAMAWEAAKRMVEMPPAQRPRKIVLLIGPEGGWTQQEIELFDKAGLTAVSLGPSILRIETAAVAAAAIVAAVLAPAIEK